MRVSREEKTLGYLGPRGTHSEEVALYLCERWAADGAHWHPVSQESISDAIRAVAQGTLDACAVPVENSLEGSIPITLDTLAHDVDLQVELELVWAVHNRLLAKNRREPVRAILSHAQPLAQCRAYLRSQYPQAVLRQTASTARAAEIVASGETGWAAIGTRRAGELYGLQTIADEIQDNPANCTRFLVLTKPGKSLLRGRDKTSIVCQINGEKAGSLCEVLLEFARRDVNLVRIESRPARTGLGAYIFFFDLDMPGDLPQVQAAIEAVRQKSFWLKNLGSFAVWQADAKSFSRGEREDI